MNSKSGQSALGGCTLEAFDLCAQWCAENKQACQKRKLCLSLKGKHWISCARMWALLQIPILIGKEADAILPKVLTQKGAKVNLLASSRIPMMRNNH